METGCPFPMELLGTVDDCDLSLESQFHDLLREHRVYREWFHDNEYVRGVINPILEQNEREFLRKFHQAFSDELPSPEEIEEQLKGSLPQLQERRAAA